METELLIAYQYSEFRGLFWTFVLYWSSVPFGLMAASHVAARSLHLAIIAMIMLLYISFSVWMGYVLATNAMIVAGFVEDIRAIEELESQGVASILAVHDMAFHSKVPKLTFVFALGGTLFSTVTFLWYSHFRKG
jgi:hypothetical protein